jgi:hypothetical protein
VAVLVVAYPRGQTENRLTKDSCPSFGVSGAGAPGITGRCGSIGKGLSSAALTGKLIEDRARKDTSNREVVIAMEGHVDVRESDLGRDPPNIVK